MPASYKCECGKEFTAQEPLPGQGVKCPQCGAVVLSVAEAAPAPPKTSEAEVKPVAEPPAPARPDSAPAPSSGEPAQKSDASAPPDADAGAPTPRWRPVLPPAPSGSVSMRDFRRIWEKYRVAEAKQAEAARKARERREAEIAAAAATDKTCLNCHAVAPLDAEICPECGHKFSTVTPLRF